MIFSFIHPPKSLCLLRTSALGDITHVVPLVRTLQAQWPATRLTWIIGKIEYKLIGGLAGVEFLVFDKSQGIKAFREIHAKLKKRQFDVLLHLQVALRANLLSALVDSPLRIGYDRARSRDFHGWFINHRIEARSGEHVLEAMASFLKPLGLKQTQIQWNIPVPEDAQEFAAKHLPGDQPTLAICPCSSHPLRNWRPERYAAVADYAAQKLAMRVVLCGGRSLYEREFSNHILSQMRTQAIDLVGKDTLKQLLALLKRATLVLTPDSGPMHIANAVGAKVLGLHAASNPDRSGPYSDRRWCVNRYDAASRKFRGKPASDLRWGTKLEYPDVMDLIETDGVIERLEAFMCEHVLQK